MVEVECNLEALTRGILDYATINEVPLRYQRNTTGVSARLCQMLGQVVRARSCYHKHHVGG